MLKTGESLEIANKLYESGYFEYAQPSFARFQGLMNEYYQNQWGLNNTGQYGGTTGIDIKAAQAWGIATGSNVKVAVVDQGVDLTHPDLQANLLSGYDATDGSLGGIYGACLDYDVHGTACAGIIAAADNMIGTKGVAPNCKIVPVRVSYGAYHYYYGYSEIWEDDWTVDAINYAWEHANADVISCSWGAGTIPALNAEIHNAITQGRGGLGCVVVFAAGNSNQPSVSYPASLADVIAVGAIDKNGIVWDYSCRDNTLDVVAPSGNIDLNGDIVTTDRMGTYGYEIGDYTLRFGGTSAACPQVSGIAALVLSVNPNLTAQ